MLLLLFGLVKLEITLHRLFLRLVFLACKMSQRGQVLQAIGDDGIYYSWYGRPYNRRVPKQSQQQSTSQEEGIFPTLEMLNPQETQLPGLGQSILV